MGFYEATAKVLLYSISYQSRLVVKQITRYNVLQNYLLSIDCIVFAKIVLLPDCLVKQTYFIGYSTIFLLF